MKILCFASFPTNFPRSFSFRCRFLSGLGTLGTGGGGMEGCSIDCGDESFGKFSDSSFVKFSVGVESITSCGWIVGVFGVVEVRSWGLKE